MYQFVDVAEPGRASGGLTMGFGAIANLDEHFSRDGAWFQTLAVDGRGLLQSEANVVDIAGRHGRFFKSAKLAVRSLTVLVKLGAESDRGLRKLCEDVNQVLHFSGRSGPQVLRFSDEADCFYQAVFVSAEQGQEVSRERFVTLRFDCYDPFKYRVRNPVTGTRIDYRGVVESFPVVTLRLSGGGTELRLLHVQKQQYVRLRGQFQAGNVIVVDMKKRTVTQNGRSILSDLDMVNSRFFSYVKGRNDLTCSLAATIQSEFSEVYM